MAKLKRTKREALRTQRLAAERSAQAEATLAARQQQAAESPPPRWYIKYDRSLSWGTIEEREESHADTIEDAAQAFAQARGEGAPTPLGRGNYQLPSGQAFRVYRPRNVISRGIDEERTARSLAARFRHGYAVRELNIWGEPDTEGKAAQGRSDLVIIQDTEVHGFEIKTAQDSLTLFARQRPIYEHQFHRCVLAVTEKHAHAALEAAPPPWGVVLLDEWHEVDRVLRAPDLNPRATFGPVVLLANLWLSDLEWILAASGRERYGTRAQMLRWMQQRFSPPQVYGWALAALIRRSAAGGRVQAWKW